MSLNPQVRMLEIMKNKMPAYRIKDGEDLAVWQAKARPQLEKLLGLPMEQAEESNFRIDWVHEEADFTEYRFFFESEPDVTVVCHLLLPKSVPQKDLPLIICLQGHAKGMHISLGRPKYPGDEETINGGDRNFAQQIIARGQAALAIDQRGFGERGGTPEGPACVQPSVQALMLGKTIIGQRCWDVSRAIDEIEKHFPQIDMNRIAIMGNSGGGTTTIYAAAVEPRIAAAMPSCAFCGFMASIGTQHHCLCNYVPAIMNDFDMGDLAGLIAPRPFIPINGKFDKIFPIDSANEQFDVAMKYYRAAGVEENACHIEGPEGHRFYAALGWPAFDKLTGWKK